MAKWIKILLALVVATPIVAATALVTLVNPNDYKPELERLVSEQTGRDFNINGEIGISVFPWLGFEVEGVQLANLSSFSPEPMFEVERAAARLKLLPLFTGTLRIAAVEIKGLTATIGIQENGQPSWADMLAASSEAESPATAEQTDSASELPDFSLTKLEVSGAEVRWLDKPVKSETRLSPINLSIGHAEPGKPFPLSASLVLEQLADGVTTRVDTALESQVLLDPKANSLSLADTTLELDLSIPGLKRLQGEIAATIMVSLDGSQASLTELVGQLNNMTLAGDMRLKNLLEKPSIAASLKLGQLVMEDFIETASKEPDQSSSQSASSEDLNSTVVDVSALNSLNATLDLAIETLSASGLVLNNASLKAQIVNGLLTVEELSSDLYQGRFEATAEVNARSSTPRYSWEHSLKGVQAEPLQEDVMQDAYISGIAEMTTALTLSGNTIGELRRALNGQGNLRFENGALKGINVAGALRKAFAAFKKQPLPENDGEVLDTDFSAATASFTIANGVMNNPDLLIESPLIRITGAGDVNLVDETINYRAKPVIVATLEGQGGRSLDDLDGLPIPVKCTGALQQPDCRTDFSGLLKDQAKQALEKEKAALEKKADEEKARLEQKRKEAEEKAKKKLEDKAQDLLNKWR